MNLMSAIRLYAGGPGSGPKAPCLQCGPGTRAGVESGVWKRSARAPRMRVASLVLDQVGVDKRKIERYAKAMKEGVKFPLIEVSPGKERGYGKRFYIEDGYHRFLAYRKAFPSAKTIPVIKRRAPWSEYYGR